MNYRCVLHGSSPLAICQWCDGFLSYLRERVVRRGVERQSHSGESCELNRSVCLWQKAMRAFVGLINAMV